MEFQSLSTQQTNTANSNLHPCEPERDMTTRAQQHRSWNFLLAFGQHFWDAGLLHAIALVFGSLLHLNWYVIFGGKSGAPRKVVPNFLRTECEGCLSTCPCITGITTLAENKSHECYYSMCVSILLRRTAIMQNQFIKDVHFLGPLWWVMKL